MKNAFQWWLVLMLALLTIVCGGSSPEPPAPAASAATRQPAGEISSRAPTTPSEREQATEHEFLSVLTVDRQVDVLAEREGVIVSILRDEGDQVAAGATLAHLDDRELRAKLDRARADLNIALSNVKYNEAEVRAKEAAHRRAREMRQLGLNSDADLEEAEFRAKGAQYDLESWRAAVERNQADIRLLELELEKTRIRAPFRGVVARRYVRPGENVSKGHRCFLLSQLAPLQVRFLVSETIQPPQPGQAINVTPVADIERVYVARVLRVSPTVDAASGSYDVTAQLTGKDLSELRPGMSVRIFWQNSSPR